MRKRVPNQEGCPRESKIEPGRVLRDAASAGGRQVIEKTTPGTWELASSGGAPVGVQSRDGESSAGTQASSSRKKKHVRCTACGSRRVNRKPSALWQRLARCWNRTWNLTLHPTKTRIVSLDAGFDFLGSCYFRDRHGPIRSAPDAAQFVLSWREPYGLTTHVRFEREGGDGDVRRPTPIGWLPTS